MRIPTLWRHDVKIDLSPLHCSSTFAVLNIIIKCICIRYSVCFHSETCAGKRTTPKRRNRNVPKNYTHGEKNMCRNTDSTSRFGCIVFKHVQVEQLNMLLGTKIIIVTCLKINLFPFEIYIIRVRNLLYHDVGSSKN